MGFDEVRFCFFLLLAKGYVGAGSVTEWRCSQLVVGIFVHLLQFFVSPTETLLLYLLLLKCEVWEAISGADIIWRGQFMKNFLALEYQTHLITPKVIKQAQKSTSFFFGWQTSAQKSRDGYEIRGEPDTSGFSLHWEFRQLRDSSTSL